MCCIPTKHVEDLHKETDCIPPVGQNSEQYFLLLCQTICCDTAMQLYYCG